MQKPWTITQLHLKMNDELSNPNLTKLERIMIETICKKEIREKAVEWKQKRKLTPGEQSILDNI